MALTDYIPNVFGQAAPSYLQGLLGAEETQNLQNRANVQGLLGAGLALAQGMSRTGPRRSAAENILGALAGGFGAAGGAYDQGIKNYVTQQQIAQTQLAQGQAVSKLRSIAEAKAKYPDLAPLFDIDPGEATKQVINRERAKMYGFGGEATQGQVPAQMPAQDQTQVVPQGQLQPTQAVPMVDQANVAKANENRRKAAFAYSMGDEKMGKFFTDEAERLDPKEQLFFRDGRLISSKRGELANYGGGRILSDEEATSLGLDISRGKWTMKDNIPSLVQGTSKTNILSKQEAQTLGLDVNNNKTYQRKPDGTIDYVQGSEIQKTTQLSDAQAKDLGLDISRGQKYQQKTTGDIDVIQGTMQDAPKYTGMYANVALEEFQTSDVTKLTADQRKKVGQIAESRTGTAAEKGAPKIYTGQLSKTTAGDVEKQVITTADAVTRLNSIQFSYRPEYQNIGFRTKQAWNTLRDKYVGLPEADKRQLAEYSQYRQNALQNLNQTIKDITGAAMGVDEAKRIVATLPDPGSDIFGGDSPTEFEAKLNNGITQTKYALARRTYALKKGLNWESTPLDKMPSIINERGAAIAKQYKLDPKKAADLQTINRQLAAEFGVSF
jgi:hypothetical protein